MWWTQNIILLGLFALGQEAKAKQKKFVAWEAFQGLRAESSFWTSQQRLPWVVLPPLMVSLSYLPRLTLTAFILMSRRSSLYLSNRKDRSLDVEFLLLGGNAWVLWTSVNLSPKAAMIPSCSGHRECGWHLNRIPHRGHCVLTPFLPACQRLSNRCRTSPWSPLCLLQHSEFSLLNVHSTASTFPRSAVSACAMWALDAHCFFEAKDCIVLFSQIVLKAKAQAWAPSTLTLLQLLSPPRCSSITWPRPRPRHFARARSLPRKPFP